MPHYLVVVDQSYMRNLLTLIVPTQLLSSVHFSKRMGLAKATVGT